MTDGLRRIPPVYGPLQTVRECDDAIRDIGFKIAELNNERQAIFRSGTATLSWEAERRLERVTYERAKLEDIRGLIRGRRRWLVTDGNATWQDVFKSHVRRMLGDAAYDALVERVNEDLREIAARRAGQSVGAAIEPRGVAAPMRERA